MLNIRNVWGCLASVTRAVSGTFVVATVCTTADYAQKLIAELYI